MDEDEPNSAIDSGEIDQAENGLRAIQKSHNENEENLSSLEFEEPATSKKGNDAGHGNRFQSKLLMLYAMRAINAGYQFYLGTELEDVGGKFDDLIFKYKDKNDATTGRYHYLQAKHKLNENDPKQQIKESHLTCTGKDNNFDLKKYFQSHVKIKSRGDDIENCIICTNVDFDHSDLIKNDILLLGVQKSNWPKILDCSDDKTQQAFYKIKFNDKLLKHMGNDLMINDFFEKLIFAVKMPNENELGNILSKELGKYFKLSNAEIPSAYVMNEMVNWFKRKENYWLTPEKAKETLTGKTDEVMSLSQTTSISIDYQKQLSKNLEFNDASTDQLMQELKLFWDNSEKIMFVKSKTPKLTAVKVISAIKKLTDFPNKDDYLVISSQRLQEERNQLESTLKVKMCHHLLVAVDENNSLQVDQFYENLFNKVNVKKKIILISSKNFNKSVEDLIAVKDLSETTKEFIKSKQVSFQGTAHTVSDLIDLNKANELFGSNLIENLLQSAEDEIIEIPFFASSNSQESLYIKRQVAFPFTDELIKDLARKKEPLVKDLMEKCKFDSNGLIQWHLEEKEENEKLWKDIAIILKEMNMSDSSLLYSLEKVIKDKCQVDSKGRIQWLTKSEREKEKLWKDMAINLKENNVSDSSLLDTLSEEKLIDPSNKTRIIITGVAGTGKSTILSHYYKVIKEKHSDWLAIKINLADHTNALVKINLKENASEFFINATGIDQNPFFRLLLEHRLETGDRIVIILDGFDEIDTKCQNKIVELVKNLNESIPIYITTRPHMANHLQFELSQLAYSLVKFTEEDQINYLTSIWTAYSVKEGVNYEEVIIKGFAKELIKRVSISLNDREKEFIGIPLQCRILAECFQLQIIKIKTLHDLSHLIEDQQLDMASLYKMLFEEKRRVFRDEKIKIHSDNNHIAIESIDKSITKTEIHLRKLAIQTIIEEQEYVDILFPSMIFTSENDRKEKEKNFNESGIRFGLLNKNYGNRVQFLHRTYAEYLVSDYIYNGFLLDEKRHNKLLENESIRKWIAEKLLVEDKYNGVRVFFDSMLKEILDQEEWKRRIKQRSLPDRLQNFARLLLCDHRKDWILHVAFKGRNSNILLLILDCLDVELLHKTPVELQSVIIRVIDTPFKQRTDVFNRILAYFNDADDHQLKGILTVLCKHSIWWQASNELEVKQENVKHNMENLFNFMEGRREKVKRMLENDELFNFNYMPVFFMHHGCNNLVKKYFKLASSIYSDDFDMIKFMKKVIFNYLQKKDWQIEKTLIVLRDLGRGNVLPELSRFVLLSNSEILHQDVHISTRSSLEGMGMTGLHGMACRGDMKSIEKEIGRFLGKPELYQEKVRNVFFGLTTNVIIDIIDIDSIFYVAAAYGHEEICGRVVLFLGKMNDDGERIQELLIDAIKNYENMVMVRTILKSVKAVGGQNALIQLIQPVFRYFVSYSDFRRFQVIKQLFETLFRIVVEDDLNGYLVLNDLVFENYCFLKALQHVPCDIMQRMIDVAGGFEDWMKRLMNRDIIWAFDVLSLDGFLDNLDQKHHIPKLIDILITIKPLLNKRETNFRFTVRKSKKRGEGRTNSKSKLSSFFQSTSRMFLKKKRRKAMSSYWSEFLEDKYSSAKKENFIEVIAKRFGEDDCKRLLLIRDENNIIVIFRYLIQMDSTCLERILSNLPESVKKEIEDLWKEEAPRLVDHFFSSPTFLATLDGCKLFNAITYYLENGNRKQLSKFSQVLKVRQLEGALRYVEEWEEKNCKEFAQLLKEKLPDSKEKGIYSSLIEKYLQ